MEEIVANIHMHTTYSDGHKNHLNISRAALEKNIDVLVITDHNVLVSGFEGYFRENGNQVLVLIGEEIHDQSMQPQHNHILAIGITRELAQFASDPQNLINLIHQEKGLAIIAHPHDPGSTVFQEPGITWINWDIDNFDGIELWNAMSEFKSLLKSKLHALFYALQPNRIATSPFYATLKKWDELLSKGKRVFAIGGTDAHALPGKMGPFRKTLFPYRFHFSTINTHLLIKTPLSGNSNIDKKLVMSALSSGNGFIGYDLPHSTKGFRFTAHGRNQTVIMGDEISSQNGITFQIHLPIPTECHLLHNGKIIKTWNNNQNCTYITNKPGVYRVEAYIKYLQHRRGWIFSNPIYVTR